jgi:hypothetical protein
VRGNKKFKKIYKRRRAGEGRKKEKRKTDNIVPLSN